MSMYYDILYICCVLFGHKNKQLQYNWVFSGTQTHVVHNGDVAAGLVEEQRDDLRAAVLAGAHQGGGSLIVLYVDVGATVQQRPHHLLTPVAHRQHQRRLAGLRG